MTIPLEDQFQDVIGKARRGLKYSESLLAQRAGIPLETLEALQEGQFDADAAVKIAKILELDPTALTDLGKESWYPNVPPLPPTLAAFNTPFGGDMTVNSYLVWDRDGGRAAAFDTGSGCAEMLQTLKAHQLTLDSIFLTHTHPDHVAALDELRDKTGAAVFVSQQEAMPKTTAIHEGQRFTVGALTISARLTPGHSPGGLTYVIEGLEETVAVVGDALFAGSMGGVAPELYKVALQANRDKILSLSETTFICPGHGPVTTVGEEKRQNPFYAGWL